MKKSENILNKVKKFLSLAEEDENSVPQNKPQKPRENARIPFEVLVRALKDTLDKNKYERPKSTRRGTNRKLLRPVVYGYCSLRGGQR